MKAFLIQAIAVALAGASIGSCSAPWQVATKPPAAQNVAVTQSSKAPSQATAQAAFGTGGTSGWGTPLHFTISGSGSADGTYFLDESLTLGGRCWFQFGIFFHESHFVDASGISHLVWIIAVPGVSDFELQPIDVDPTKGGTVSGTRNGVTVTVSP